MSTCQPGRHEGSQGALRHTARNRRWLLMGRKSVSRCYTWQASRHRKSYRVPARAPFFSLRESGWMRFSTHPQKPSHSPRAASCGLSAAGVTMRVSNLMFLPADNIIAAARAPASSVCVCCANIRSLDIRGEVKGPKVMSFVPPSLLPFRVSSAVLRGTRSNIWYSRRHGDGITLDVEYYLCEGRKENVVGSNYVSAERPTTARIMKSEAGVAVIVGDCCAPGARV